MSATGNTSEAAARAAALKDEGNKLYIAKKYSAAHTKYSEAIEADKENAVLWANRAACSLALNKLPAAEADCEKATQLNPQYTKAWARLGNIRKALCLWQPSLDAYMKALELLPASNLSQADKNIQRECELDIDFVKNKMKQKAVPLNPNAIISFDKDDYPWDRVLKLEKTMRSGEGWELYSSRWMLLEATLHYDDGMRGIRQVKALTLPNGNPGFSGVLGTIRHLVTALVTDHRVFRIEDREYPSYCNIQAIFEAQHDKASALVAAGSVEGTMAKLREMQGTENWETVLRAIETTIRLFVFRAFNEGSVQGDHSSALESYQLAIDLVEQCLKLWKDKSEKELGEVITRDFARGVRSMWLDCYLMAHKANPRQFTREKLRDAAQDMLREITALAEDEIFSLDEATAQHFAFYQYPRAQALGAIALCFREQAEALPKGSSEASSLLRHAADHYRQAAEIYPEDDECHCYYLAVTFDALVRCGGARFTEVLGVATKMKGALPKMRVLWEKSAMSQARDAQVAHAVAVEEQLLRLKQSGRIKFTDTVSMDMFRR
ncbi:TPR-like protein [Phanerochaete sordida]|uniref:TPR-like protein n=1 Tax=Phanerochaete sordida TaxID=48140 RepID=A0A9P3L9Z9_9APHY|nr:TPR-like protein [Phanerochaete sordida]